MSSLEINISDTDLLEAIENAMETGNAFTRANICKIVLDEICKDEDSLDKLLGYLEERKRRNQPAKLQEESEELFK